MISRCAGDSLAPAKTFRFYPKVYKAAIAAAESHTTFEEYSAKVRELEIEQPISMRHVVDLRSDREPIDPSLVDPGVGTLGQSELCAWIREHRPALSARMVIVSAHALTMQSENLTDGEILPKPASAAQLLDAIERATRR